MVRLCKWSLPGIFTSIIWVGGHVGTSQVQSQSQAIRNWLPGRVAHPYISVDYNKIGACGALGPPYIMASDGYMVHPTILDASFHLGASLNNLSKGGHGTRIDTTTKTMGTIKVPTSFGVYSNIIGLASHSAFWANVADLQQRSEELVTSTYKLGQCSNTSTINIVDMLSKPLQRADTKASNPAVTNPKEHLTYMLHWKAVELNPSLGDKPNMTTQQRWQKLSTEGRHVWEASLEKETSIFTCATTNLQIVQHALGEQALNSERYHLLGTVSRCSLGIPSDTVKHDIIAATALSFVRSAAQEQPKIVWQSTIDSVFNASTGIPVPRADAFGVQRVGSLILQAQMLPTFLASALQIRGNLSKQTMLITGGLGEIGMLVGSWASANMVGHICIASRSGHPSREADGILSLVHYATICRCDVACTEEAFHLTSAKATMVRSIMHAGELKTFPC